MIFFNAAHGYYRTTRRREMDIHKIFREKVKLYIPRAKIISFDEMNITVEKEVRQRNQPDFFVHIDGKNRPVEIKNKSVDQAHCRQTERYIKAYMADKGYILGSKLSPKTVLPENVIFVQFPKLPVRG